MYIVTGVSRGLGKAIVEELLGRKEHVIGIGRTHSFDHPNFSFLECDFSTPDKIENLEFPQLKGTVTLINNAGIIGDIKRISDQNTLDLEHVMAVNVISPMQLTQLIYGKTESKDTSHW